MAKPRNRLADFAVYAVIRMAAAFLRALSFSTAIRFALGLAWVMMTISPRRFSIARNNLRQAFPNRYTADEIDRLVKEMYRHFCRVIIEIIHLDRILRVNNWRDLLVFGSQEQYENFYKILLGDRGALLVTAHFGNWELASYVLGLVGFPGYAIARPLDNPHLDRWMRNWRERTGQRMIAKNGEFHLIEEALRKGRFLGTLGDQDAGQRGAFVPFFHQPASTHKAIALLAMEHDCKIVVVGATRVDKDFRYCFTFEDVIDPAEYEKDPNAVQEITARFTRGIESMIRLHPEQYLWIHRRWKHQPPVKKRKAA